MAGVTAPVPENTNIVEYDQIRKHIEENVIKHGAFHGIALSECIDQMDNDVAKKLLFQMILRLWRVENDL